MTVELFKLIHDNGSWEPPVKNGDVHSEKLTAEDVKQYKRTLKVLGMLDRFRFESQGLFTARTSTHTESTVPQYLIDEGVDSDTYEVTSTIYEPINQ